MDTSGQIYAGLEREVPAEDTKRLEDAINTERQAQLDAMRRRLDELGGKA